MGNKMARPKRVRHLLVVTLIGMAILTGCANILSTASGKGSLSLSISSPSSSAKAIVPSASDYASAIKSYMIVVSNTDNSYTSSSVTGGVCTITGIVAGSYTVSVAAYCDAATQDSTTRIASGSATSVAISAGATASASVILAFSQSASAGATNAGGFSLQIAWPSTIGVTYGSAKLDGVAIAASASPSNDGTNYSTTLVASGLSGSTHLLAICFTNSSGTTLGPYYESVYVWDGVTSTRWANPSGTQSSTLAFTADEFASSNANLSGLSCANADATALSISPAFAVSTLGYTLSTGFTSSVVTVIATATSGGQDLSCTVNSVAKSWSSISGSTYAFTISSLQLVSGTNTFAITVTAPDRQTTKTYTISVACGATGVTISNPSASYLGMGFPASATIVQGQLFSCETSNATLDAITSGWTWCLDGGAQSGSSQRYLLTPATTSSMLGAYSLSASVVGPDGVTYSGRTALTVTRRSAMNLSAANATVSLSSGGAGSTTAGYADGSASVALFNHPHALTTDGSSLYVADYNNSLIRQVYISTGNVITFAGVQGSPGSWTATDSSDGSLAKFRGLQGITTDGSFLYVTDSGAGSIRKISIATTAVSTLVSGLGSLSGITTDGTNLYVVQGNRILEIAIATQTVSTLAGSSTAGWNDATGTSATFNGPVGLATDGVNLFVAGNNGQNIRQVVISTGVVTTLAGSISLPTPVSGSADDTGTAARFKYPYDVATDGTYVYVADTYNHEIRKIAIATGVVTTIAGSTSSGHASGTGPAAFFTYPNGITTDGSYLYVADTNNNLIRKIAPN
jgi:hypothetical protein